MWREKLEEVKKYLNGFGRETDAPASEKEIQIFTEEVKGKFGFDLPEDYIDLLKVMNGYEFNGFIIYGIDGRLLEKKPDEHINGFIELSEIWYENEHQKQYAIIGEDNISWYVYDLVSKKYVIVDNPGGGEMEYFDRFDEIIAKLLTDSIS
ncbi:SMI1/KNR4 family protein [Gracilibacillus oryzae]|uniref:SMI1/KNR4 family protein n=1 Tax=Gracilibacillus oryzae TaxID=1672701 RepID=A0A7C8KMG0_9BACI|nr:YrhA family protein [Gracilibacillus oryzae]KAB8126149.1 SMI1/KNR4 family protein [Gracilibacillus oryzae]